MKVTTKDAQNSKSNLLLEKKVESASLTKKAFSSLLCNPVSSQSPSISPAAGEKSYLLPSTLRDHDGSNIVKKNSARKTRYVFLFPGELELPSMTTSNIQKSIKIGNLHDLNTSNPRITFNLPGAVLEMRGVFITAKNPLWTLRPCSSQNKGKEPNILNCEHVFDSIVVFSEWSWKTLENSGNISKSSIKSPSTAHVNSSTIKINSSEDINIVSSDSSYLHISKSKHKTSQLPNRRSFKKDKSDDTAGGIDTEIFQKENFDSDNSSFDGKRKRQEAVKSLDDSEPRDASYQVAKSHTMSKGLLNIHNRKKFSLNPESETQIERKYPKRKASLMNRSYHEDNFSDDSDQESQAEFESEESGSNSQFSVSNL